MRSDFQEQTLAAAFGHNDFSRLATLENVLRRFENKAGLGGGLVVARKAVVFQDRQDFLFEINRCLALNFRNHYRLIFRIGRNIVLSQKTKPTNEYYEQENEISCHS